MSQRSVGFIGLGIMGSSMARNLLNQGFELFVYNRSEEKSRELEKLGARVVSSPAELAAEVSLICLCLSNGEVVREVCFGEGGLSQNLRFGSTIIDFSTISPGAAIKLADELAEYRAVFLDSPVSGGDIGAKNGTLTIMVGGDKDAFSRNLDVYEAVGRDIFHVGMSGAGQKTKCVNQVVVALTVAAMTEGLFLAENSGLDLAQTLEVIRGGAAGSWSLDNYAPRLLDGDLGPGFLAEHMLKDLRFALGEADNCDTALPVTAMVKELYLQLCQSAGEEFGNHALIQLYRELKPE